MILMEVKVLISERAIEKTQGRFRDFDKVAAKAVDKAVTPLYKDWKSKLPWNRGDYISKLSLEIKGLEATIKAGASFSRFLEVPTKPHLIKGNPYLHFINKKTGDEVFTRFVRHPGISNPKKPLATLEARLKKEVPTLIKTMMVDEYGV